MTKGKRRVTNTTSKDTDYSPPKDQKIISISELTDEDMEELPDNECLKIIKKYISIVSSYRVTYNEVHDYISYTLKNISNICKLCFYILEAETSVIKLSLVHGNCRTRISLLVFDFLCFHTIP